MTHRINAVIMTKSPMNGGFCVAGIDTKKRKWVRFTAGSSGEPVTALHLRSVNCEECGILDAVSVEAEYSPYKHHSEDCIIQPRTMEKLGSITVHEAIGKFCPLENYRFIYANTYESITEEQLAKSGINYSLMLARVHNLNINYEQNFEGKIKPKAYFYYNGFEYIAMRITDPNYLLSKDKRHLVIQDALIVVSLPRSYYEHNRRYYKLVAGIFDLSQQDIKTEAPSGNIPLL